MLLVGCLVQGGAVERHFNMTVSTRMEMEYGENCEWPLGEHCEPNFLAYEKGGKLMYRRGSANTGELGPELEVPAEADVLVIDGTYRSVTAINGHVPGPPIEVTEGDTVVVHLTNRLPNEATTLHFHGMWQRGTPWMDGVSQITQCAVLPGETFTYRFVAEPAGTHFYHSHHGVQRPEGIFGALVVHPKPKAGAAVALPQPGVGAAAQCPVMILSVWQHLDTQSLYTQRDGPGWFPDGADGKPWKWSRDVSGKLVGEIPMVSGLINGRGRVPGGPKVNLTVFEVDGMSHCFRVIASQEGKALRLSIDQHSLSVTSTDGNALQPIQGLQSVIIFPGETVDITASCTVTAHDPPGAVGCEEQQGNYWVRASTLEVGMGNNHTAWGVLRYPGAALADPTSSPRDCTADARCKVFNCPFPSFHPSDYTDCIIVDQARDADASSTAIAAGAQEVEGEGGGAAGDVAVDLPMALPMIEKFLNFGFEPSINNRRFHYPEAPPLTQPPSQSRMLACDDARCDAAAFPKEPCECTHVLDLPFNRTIQLVLTNLGASLIVVGVHSPTCDSACVHIDQLIVTEMFVVVE